MDAAKHINTFAFSDEVFPLGTLKGLETQGITG